MEDSWLMEDSGLNPDPGHWPRPQPTSRILPWLHGLILSFSCEVFYTFFNLLNKLRVSQRFLCLGNSWFQDILDSEVNPPAQINTFNTKILAILFFFLYSFINALSPWCRKQPDNRAQRSHDGNIYFLAICVQVTALANKEINNGTNCS